MSFKIPESVLVVIHTSALEVLLIERARNPGYWQSVTGSLDRSDEPPLAAAIREVAEETGIDARLHVLRDWKQSAWFDIYPQWRHRYAPDVTRNLEHVFSLELAQRVTVTLAPSEHTAQLWLPRSEAAARVFSHTNRDAILRLGP
jgi:dATP pyrophosphohydrolase